MPLGMDTSLEGGTASELARQLEIDDSDLDQLGELFAEAAAAQGADGGLVFAALRKGAPLGKALGISAKAIELLYFRACKWFQAGAPGKAEAIFRTLCILDPKQADFWAGLGVCLRMREAWDEALAALGQAAEKRPNWAVPHFHRLEIFVRRGAWGEAASEMAAFEAKKGPGLPPQFAIEAGKYKRAIEKRHLKEQRSGRRL
jgi:tetratricopeptide (TPR) repeat protein